MRLDAGDLSALKGQLAGHWTVTVNGNWRLTFSLEDGDAVLVDYQDYHCGIDDANV
jgi:proteic killer suppression protein